MKKTYFLLFALLTSFLISCDTQGHKLYAEGDEQIFDEQTLETTWSHMQHSEYFQVAIGLKKSPEFAAIFAEQCEKQVKQGKSQIWAASYAAKIAAGESEEKAKTYADASNSTHSEIRVEAYKRMLSKGKREEFAQRYAEVYDLLRRGKKSHVFANHYAYQIAKGKSVLFVTHFAEKVAAGKSQSWANAYAFAMERTCLPGFATKMADAYIEKKGQGMRTREAQEAACRIAAGKETGDINSKDENGDTDLIKAARQGDITQIKVLIGGDADCNMQNNKGKTALMVAAEKGDVPIVASLLSADMKSLNIKDNKGITALTYARRGKSKASKQKKMQYKSIIRMFDGVAADENGIRRFIQRFVPGYNKVVSAAGTAAALAAL